MPFIAGLSNISVAGIGLKIAAAASGSIVIDTQPQNASQSLPWDDPSSAWSFSVAVTATNAGTLTYTWEWRRYDADTETYSDWAVITDDTNGTQENPTAYALGLSNDGNLVLSGADGWIATEEVRCIISGTTADSVTSNSAELN